MSHHVQVRVRAYVSGWINKSKQYMAIYGPVVGSYPCFNIGCLLHRAEIYVPWDACQLHVAKRTWEVHMPAFPTDLSCDHRICYDVLMTEHKPFRGISSYWPSFDRLDTVFRRYGIVDLFQGSQFHSPCSSFSFLFPTTHHHHHMSVWKSQHCK